MSFCPRCGNPATTGGTFCEACLREHYPLIESVKRVEAILCPSCSRTYSKNTWGTSALQNLIERQLERAISFRQGARIEGIIVEPVEPQPGKQTLQLVVTGTADADAENAYDEYYETNILVHGQLCTECQRLKNQYFTGILQLRRPNDEVQYEIERLLGRALTNAKDVTGGIDYYVSDHRILQNVARAVHDRYGGDLTIRAQHFSYDNLASKNLYRVNACLRLPKYWTGSVLQAASKVIWVKSMGRALKGVDLRTGKNISVPFHLEYPEYTLQRTTVVTTRPSITILEPETYQTVPIMNSDLASWRELKQGAPVIVVETTTGWLLVRRSDESKDHELGSEV
jgi:NMD protein affecting ribosome stability and mRNA decay